MSRQMWAMVLAAVLVALPCVAADENVTAKGKIESVTLYRGQALVTRALTVKADKGAVQLVVTDLPARVRPDSLYAAADATALVRAVRFRTRVVTEAPRADVRALEKQMADLEKDRRKNAQDQSTVTGKINYIGKLEGFVAPTAKTELSKGVLNADTLEKLTLFIFEQRTKLSAETLSLREKEQELREQIDTLQRKIRMVTQTRSRSLREAVVFLDKVKDGNTKLTVSYLVEGATWVPAYNLRGDLNADKVAVEYNAVITQMSGEDWRNVALVLSTASPSMTADAPMLAPLLVALRPRMRAGKQLEYARGQFSKANTLVQQQEHKRQSALDRYSQIEAQWWLNKAAHGYQIWELYVPEPLARVARVMVDRQASGLSVSYKLTGRSNVDSRQDQQIARIADLTLPTQFTNVAIPLLSERVYRRAMVKNSSKIALLEGRGNVYLDGSFVGKGTVPMVASGQRFLAGFGIAPQLRAKRELVSKKEKIQGANRDVTYRYRLLIDNYSDQERQVRVFDRVPYAQEEIRVTQLDGFDQLSKDPQYVRVFREQGILRWDIAVDKQASGVKAKTIDYGFKLEYDKNTDITTATSVEREAKVKAMFEAQMMAH
jgi:uncharacterized protein (TIGR02231 family)